MTTRASFHRTLRIAQRVAILGFATAATALADGSGAGSLSFAGGPAFANEIEAGLVRAIVGLRQSGLQQALGEIDRVLARSPNFRLGYMIKGDLLMAPRIARRPDGGVMLRRQSGLRVVAGQAGAAQRGNRHRSQV